MRQDDWISKMYHGFDLSQRKFGFLDITSYIKKDHEQKRPTKDESGSNPKKPKGTRLL
jgi:hypothetical protein|tara:strand:- start:431 stop:604 length:174 start_codon:yes stop_codon:yes gene_type:complete